MFANILFWLVDTKSVENAHFMLKLYAIDRNAVYSGIQFVLLLVKIDCRMRALHKCNFKHTHTLSLLLSAAHVQFIDHF